MGAGKTQSSGARLENSPQSPRRSSGGQASLPAFFGLRLTDTAAPERTEVKAVPAQAKAVSSSASLSFAHRRAIVCRPSPVEIERRNAAMRQAAAAAAASLRDEHDWRELADLAACPEWDRTLPYGHVETACALND